MTSKRKRGRPPLPMPEAIPDTPQNVAKALFRGPPKKEWRYMAKEKTRRT